MNVIDMEKNQSTMSTSEPAPTAPPPSPSALPPSYEEAIAQSMGMTSPSINVTPYPPANSRVAVSTPCKCYINLTFYSPHFAVHYLMNFRSVYGCEKCCNMHDLDYDVDNSERRF